MAKKFDFFMQSLLKESNRNRFWLTIFVIVTFLLILFGIGYAMFSHATVEDAWEKILMLLLGAFISSYGKVMDYWFNNMETDKMLIQKADEEDDFIQEGLKKRLEGESVDVAGVLVGDPSDDTISECQCEGECTCNDCTCGEGEVCHKCSEK